MRYDDDGDGEDVGLRQLLLVAATKGIYIKAARVLPPRTNRRQTTNKRGTERKHSQLCVV